jgi:type IV pilus assembly protein PilA
MARNRGGFTFIELLVVLVIIGILAAIALPKFSATRDKAKVAALRSDVRNTETAEESYYAVFGLYANFAQLQADGLLSLSPGTTMVATGGTAGYSVGVTNPAIASTPNSCSVQVGGGAPPAVDGLITCP